MEKLVNKVLDLSCIESRTSTANMEILSLDELISDALKLIKPRADAGTVQMVNHITGGHYVMADNTRLKEVLINLFTNAINYNHPHGSVTIDCISQPGDPLRLTVTDTGIGISEADRARLFQAFVRLDSADRNINGSGLGLVISKHLIELMGGDIGYESNPDGGSTFWVELQQPLPA